MRIERLDLLAYGPFTNASLEFAHQQAGLHLIYGPNEAGKSSSLRAITDLVFGFQSRTNDDFLHPYSKLRVGAKLALHDGRTLTVVRRKAAKNTLRDDRDDAAVDEGRLQDQLGSVDRDLFRHMFGIDHQSLRAGGNEMVEGNGRVGETLFAAAAGISKLRSAQKSLLAQAEELFKSAAKTSKIRKLIEEYQELKKQQSESLVSADVWNARDELLKRLQGRQVTLQEVRLELTRRESWIQRVIDSSNPIAQLKQAKSSLEAMKHIPVLPEDFGTQCSRLLDGWRELQNKIDQLDASLEQLDTQVETIEDASHWLSFQTEIEGLLEEFGKHKSAMEDRPKREGERSTMLLRMQNILRDLGLPIETSNIDNLRLPPDKRVRIQTLGNQREGLFEKRQSLQREQSTISTDIEKALSQQKALATTKDWHLLEAKIKQHRADSGLENDLDQIDSEIRLAEAEVNGCLQRLQLNHLGMTELSSASVISDTTLNEFDEQFRLLDKRKAKLVDQIQELESEAARLEHELALIETERTIPSEADLTRLRAERDQGWQLISRLLADETVSESDKQRFLEKANSAKNISDAFSTYLSMTDSLADELRWHADKVTSKARFLADAARNKKKIGKLREDEAQLIHEQQALSSAWKDVWLPVKVEPKSPRQMRDWLGDFESLRKQYREMTVKDIQRTKLTSKVKSLAMEIQALLVDIDANASAEKRSLSELFQFAEDFVDDCIKKQSRYMQIEETLEQDRTRLADCDIELAQAKKEWEQWQADWSAEMQRVRLEKDALPAQANCVLQEVQELFQIQEDYQNLSRRIDGIDRDAADFVHRLKSVANQVLAPSSNRTTEQSIRMLRDGLEVAVKAEEKRKTLDDTRKKQQASRKEISDQRNTIAKNLDELCKQVQCNEYHELPTLVAVAGKKSSVEKEVAELEKHLVTLARNKTLDEFIAAFDAESARFDELPMQLDAIHRDLASNMDEYDRTLQEVKAAKDDLDRIDGSAKSAEIAEKIQTVASEIEDASRETITLRLASSILSKAMEKYRARNQGPVLGLASDYFARMTLQNYRSIQAEFDEQGNPSLVGVRRDGTQVSVGGMSDGTCDQLFLALRLASLEVWLDKHPPIPFVVDDILVHFDEERAQATLKVLHDFSKRTQVLFFTHHEHTLRLAESILVANEFQIVRLPDRQHI